MLKAVVEPKNKEGNEGWFFWWEIYQKKKLEDLQKLFSIFYKPLTQTLAPWKLLEKPSIKEMEKEWRYLASYIFQLTAVLQTRLYKYIQLHETALKLTLQRFFHQPRHPLEAWKSWKSNDFAKSWAFSLNILHLIGIFQWLTDFSHLYMTESNFSYISAFILFPFYYFKYFTFF